jgi:hypothetical protein
LRLGVADRAEQAAIVRRQQPKKIGFSPPLSAACA